MLSADGIDAAADRDLRRRNPAYGKQSGDAYLAVDLERAFEANWGVALGTTRRTTQVGIHQISECSVVGGAQHSPSLVKGFPLADRPPEDRLSLGPASLGRENRFGFVPPIPDPLGCSPRCANARRKSCGFAGFRRLGSAQSEPETAGFGLNQRSWSCLSPA